MIYPYGNLKFPTPYTDPTVDQYLESDGYIDQFGLLDLAIKDQDLIDNLNERIEDSRGYYNDPNGFDLEQQRAENLRMYLGVQANAADYYDQEDPYIENQIRPAVDAIVSYATARSPQSVVTPADDTPQAKKFAANLEKAHNMHSVEFDLRGIIEVQVRSWLLNQEGYIMLEYDPDYGEKGEIVPRFVHPDEIVVDKNWRYGQRPGFMTLFEKKSIEDLLHMYPEKAKDILDSVGRKRPGKRIVTREMVIKRTWFEYYNPKTERPEIGVAIHYDRVMLAKYRDINWLPGQRNFLKRQVIPIIPLNVLSDGKHGVDFSTPINDGVRLQRLINAGGKQIMTNRTRSNDTIVINGKKSGLRKEDAEDWTIGPNQKIFLKKAPDNAKPEEMIWRIPGQDVKPFVVQAQGDLRSTLGQVVGVPMDQSRSDQYSDDATLGEQLMKKSDRDSRQDMIVRAIDRMLYSYFNLLTQMMFRWYDEDHFFPYLDADGAFENIVIKRYYFDDGMRVAVRGLSTIAWDKNREQAMMIKFMDKQQISTLDAMRIAGFENWQKMYDNWVKQRKDPYELVKDADDQFDSGNAYAEFLDLLGGKTPKEKQDADREYILTLRKLMFTDKFLQAPQAIQAKIMQRLQRYLDLYELRTSLDQLSQIDVEHLNPMAPVPPPMPPQQFAQMQQPPQLPGGQPPMPPQAPPGMPPPGAMPPNGHPIFGGSGLPNPGAPATPSGISAIPSL